MLDGQTPYIEIVTNRSDNVMLTRISFVSRKLRRSTYNEATVDTKTQAHQHEDKSDLIRPKSQGAWPESQFWSQRVDNCKAQRKSKDVMHGELVILSQMCNDHLANGVCVEQTSIENERYEMVIKDDRLQVEVCGDMCRSDEEGSKSVKRLCRRLFSFALYFHNMQDALQRQHRLADTSRATHLCTVFATSTTPPYTMYH